MRVLATILPTSFFIILFSIACNRNNENNTLNFSKIESYIAKGLYQKADSLLYNSKSDEKSFTTEESMYWNLLRLNIKYVQGTLSDSDFYIADNLKNYYKASDNNDKLSKAYLFIGDIYRSVGNYPDAIKNILKAKELIADQECTALNVWISMKMGDIYLSENILDKCAEAYKEAYYSSLKTNDTLRISLAALRMGKAYIIQDDPDSAIIFFKESIRLGNMTNRKEHVTPYTIITLCDIYIQLEKYEKAYELMSRDSLNTANWAYWHFGQNNIDSAIYYFQKFLKQPSLQIQAEGLHNLIELSKLKKDEHKSLFYSTRLIEVNDSLKQESQAEKIRQSEAQHKIETIIAEAEKHDRFQKRLIVSIIVTIILGTLLIICLHFKNKAKQHQECGKKLQSKILQLSLDNIQKEKEQICDEQTSIQQQERIKELHDTDIYRSIKLNAGKSKFHLTDKQWKELQAAIDKAYNGFTGRLLEIASISEQEMYVCYLIKLEISPAAMAELLCKSKSGITMIRSRLYKKLSGQDGTAQQLDELIMML